MATTSFMATWQNLGTVNTESNLVGILWWYIMKVLLYHGHGLYFGETTATQNTPCQDTSKTDIDFNL